MRPRKLFLTKGVGFHREKLASFEEALRDAKIAHLNLVRVSSIFPPNCKIVIPSRGLKFFDPGNITFCVLAKNETNEHRRLISASVGIAIPNDPCTYGYLSEHEGFGQTEEESGEYAEDLAATMLATTLGVEFNLDDAWDKKKETYKISGKIVSSRNVTQSAVGKRNYWSTVIAAAIFCDTE